MGRTSADSVDDIHFVLDTSGMDLALEFLLPLDFRSTGFAFEDTIEFDVGEDGLELDMIELAQVTVTTENELPIELELQVYLMDAAYSVLDSIFTDDVVFLQGSEVDAEGKLVSASEETNEVSFPKEKLEKLSNVAYLMVQARMLTSGGGTQFVKLYSDLSLSFEVSMLANVRINTAELE